MGHQQTDQEGRSTWRRAVLWLGAIASTALLMGLLSGSNPNHSPFVHGAGAGHFCVDRNGWLWWARLDTISVASDVDVGELTPLDTFELDSSGLDTIDEVRLFVPRSVSGVYALTRYGRLLSLSVSDSRLSAIQLANFGMQIDKACIADDSSRTIVADRDSWEDTDPFLIDLPTRTISPLPVPVPESGEWRYADALEHAGGTRFVVAYSDERICLFDSQDLKSAIQVVKAPAPDMFSASPNRTLIALAGFSWDAVAVRNSGTLEQVESWQIPAGGPYVNDFTWLDDRRLAVRLRTWTPGDGGEVVIMELGSTRLRPVKLDFEPGAILAIAPDRLAIGDRDGGVRVIQLDP